MPKDSPANTYAQYVAESLAALGPVKTRAMFGGHNVSLHGITFGLIADNVLYLKVDSENLESFMKAQLGPFVYKTKDGKEMAMSYHQAPDCLDDWEEIEPWVRGALGAANRAKSPKTSAKKKSSRSTKKRE